MPTTYLPSSFQFAYHARMRFSQNLTVPEMIAVTEQWTGPLNSLFIAIPEVAPFLSRVQEDHSALIDARQSGTAEVALRALNDSADALDERHDHLQRALYFGMRSAREAWLGIASPNLTKVIAIDAARDALFPNGLEVINASYEGEAGNAAQMLKLAQTEYAAILAEIPIMSGLSALDLIVEIGKVGAALGEVERNKSVAVATVENQTISALEVRNRKRAWATTVEIVLGALDRSKAAPDAIQQIRRPVEDAIEKARLRQRAKQNAAGKKPPEATGG